MATMFPCPSCGGQLKFSPERMQMLCSSCGQYTDPRAYKGNDIENEAGINTTIYTCPNCAGEIQVIDNDGMEFCPYCGTQTTMQEHFSKSGVPKYILPFNLTKKEAREKYLEEVKHIHFVPDGLNIDDNIDKLVGLYTPYYLYDYSSDGDVSFVGKQTSTSGDYEVTKETQFNVRVDVDDMKVPFDASQTFDDNVSGSINPFPLNELEKFNPNFLAGFFVENSTVDKEIYVEDALEEAKNSLCNKVKAKADGYDLTSREDERIHNDVASKLQYKGCEGAYLPVYFMTTRNYDRVSYSVINGASGAVYSDMPIDKRKMYAAAIGASFAIFAVLFVLSLTFSFTYRIKNLCGFAALVSSFIAYYGAKIADGVYRRDNHLDDKGYFKSKDVVTSKNIKPIKKKAKKKITKSSTKAALSGAGAVVLFLILKGGYAFIIAGILYVIENGRVVSNVLNVILMLAMYISSFVFIIKGFNAVKKGQKTVLMLGTFGWIAAILIRIINLPNDIIYYIALAIVFAIIVFTIDCTVREYNRLATRPSPQFMKKGGKLENAKG